MEDYDQHMNQLQDQTRGQLLLQGQRGADVRAAEAVRRGVLDSSTHVAGDVPGLPARIADTFTDVTGPVPAQPSVLSTASGRSSARPHPGAGAGAPFPSRIEGCTVVCRCSDLRPGGCDEQGRTPV